MSFCHADKNRESLGVDRRRTRVKEVRRVVLQAGVLAPLLGSFHMLIPTKVNGHTQIVSHIDGTAFGIREGGGDFCKQRGQWIEIGFTRLWVSCLVGKYSNWPASCLNVIRELRESSGSVSCICWGVPHSP